MSDSATASSTVIGPRGRSGCAGAEKHDESTRGRTHQFVGGARPRCPDYRQAVARSQRHCDESRNREDVAHFPLARFCTNRAVLRWYAACSGVVSY
jgi:hypothetical protein